MQRRRCKRGVSTTLGVIIFVGILFTSVIPMALVMRQSETIYEQNELELKRQDDDQDREEIDVYVYPTGESAPDNLTISLYNRCELNSEIVRVWINDTRYSDDAIVDSMSEYELGSYDVGPQNGSIYDIYVTTRRGNVFEAGAGAISFIDGMWQVENKMINVLISSSGVVFKVYCTGPNDYSEYAQVWKIGGSAFKSFDITTNGNGDYNVEVKRGSKTIHNETVTMEWPNGPSVIWVYA